MVPGMWPPKRHNTRYKGGFKYCPHNRGQTEDSGKVSNMLIKCKVKCLIGVRHRIIIHSRLMPQRLK